MSLYMHWSYSAAIGRLHRLHFFRFSEHHGTSYSCCIRPLYFVCFLHCTTDLNTSPTEHRRRFPKNQILLREKHNNFALGRLVWGDIEPSSLNTMKYIVACKSWIHSLKVDSHEVHYFHWHQNIWMCCNTFPALCQHTWVCSYSS